MKKITEFDGHVKELSKDRNSIVAEVNLPDPDKRIVLYVFPMNVATPRLPIDKKIKVTVEIEED